MKFNIEQAVFELLPNTNLKIIEVKNIASVYGNELLCDLREEVIEILKTQEHKILSSESISYWRAVYKKMGVKPSKYLCSFESLYKRTIKTNTIQSIHPLVDFYNLMSLKHSTCIGGYDILSLGEDINLRFSKQYDSIHLIGEKKSTEIKSDSIIYVDENKTFCMHFNHRDSEVTKITKETSSAIFLIDEFKNESNIQEDFIYQFSKIFGSTSIKNFEINKTKTGVDINE